jgi:hypothetical protein
MDEGRFVDVVLRNRVNQILLERLPGFALTDAWLVSGSVFQTVWNVLTGRAPDYGIKDYDIFYFDADTSWEAEDAIILESSELPIRLWNAPRKESTAF